MKGVLIVLLIVFLTACTQQVPEIKEPEQKIPVLKEVNTMKITSPAFKHEGMIPSEYTCDGDDISPELNIAEVPENANSLVLVCDDPDAPRGTWDHWIVFNIAPSTAKIAKGAEPKGTPGKNSWGNTGYGGPCPPSGTHRYFFKLYALDKRLDLPEGASKADIQKAMQGHIIEEAQLMGKYKKI